MNEETEIIVPIESGGQSREVSEISQPVTDSQSLITAIERVALNPNADIAKMEKLMDMQERVMNREEEKAFYADLAAMQPELPRVIKSKDGHNSKYAPLEDINDAIRPAIQKYGFAVIFNIEQKEKTVDITTTLAHRRGHTQSLTIPLALDTSGSKNAVQAVGSTISYGKRYGICAILNISTGDDNDGNGPQAEELPDITDALIVINDCTTIDDLQKVFKEFWVAFPQKKLRSKLTTAKDLKKKELQNG